MENNDDRYNILYLIQSQKLGGAEISTLLLVKNLNRAKYMPYVLAPGNSIVENEFNKLDVKTISFNLPQVKTYNFVKLIINSFTLLKHCIEIRKIIKRYKIDIVHSVSNKRSAVYSILSAKISKVPVVWTIRVLDRVKIIDSILLKLSDKVIAISEAVKKRYVDESTNIKGKITRIYNAVDLKEFDEGKCDNKVLREKWDVEDNDFVVAIASRVIPIKGHITFIKAAALVLNKYPEMKFVVIGDTNYFNDSSYYQSLLELSCFLNIESEIKFVGQENNIPLMMSNIDILVLCCPDEPFGRVVIEAMAMKKPVIAPNTAGPSEIVIDGQTGYLIMPENPEKLADAIIKVYQSPNIRKKMGAASRQRVQDLFSLPKYISEYEKIYDCI